MVNVHRFASQSNSFPKDMQSSQLRQLIFSVLPKFSFFLSLKPKNQVTNVGVIMDSDLILDSHIKSETSADFYHVKTTLPLLYSCIQIRAGTPNEIECYNVNTTYCV